MRPIATRVVLYVVSASASVLDASVSPAKADEPIEMQFWRQTRVGFTQAPPGGEME